VGGVGCGGGVGGGGWDGGGGGWVGGGRGGAGGRWGVWGGGGLGGGGWELKSCGTKTHATLIFSVVFRMDERICFLSTTTKGKLKKRPTKKWKGNRSK